MRCRHCGKRYSAADAQPAPGGSSAPGEFFWTAVVFEAIAAVLWASGFVFWAAGMAVLGALPALVVPLAWYDCHGPAGLSRTGGEACSHCGGRNRVWPWSL